MSKLIIVCGLPGSGKTTLANELSKKLKVVCIHKDSVKEKLYEGLECSTLEDSKRIGKPSVNIMLHLAEEQIANGIDIIIESPFNFPEDYLLFKQWKKIYELELFSIICFINKEERKRRFLERERHASHHDIQRVNDHLPESGIEYDYATMPGEQIRISTDKPVEILVQEILLKLI